MLKVSYNAKGERSIWISHGASNLSVKEAAQLRRIYGSLAPVQPDEALHEGGARNACRPPTGGRSGGGGASRAAALP
jgi:hypothetical protein